MSSRSPERARAWLAAAAAAFLLAAWLAAPRHDPRPGRPLVVAVFDRSASVERTRPHHAAWMRARAAEEAASAERGGALFAALVFAGDCAWWLAPGAPQRELGAPPAAGDGRESDLAAALELARQGARSAGSAGGVVRLFTDGRATRAGVEAAVRELAAAGLALERAALPEPELDDVALLSLRAPERVEAGAPLACEVRAALAPAPALGAVARRVQLELALAGTGEPRTFQVERALAADGNPAVWRIDLGPAPAGPLRIEARAVLAGDPTPENDRATCWVECGGALEIAVVAAEPELARAFLADTASLAGLAFLPVSAEELPAALGRVRALATLGVADAALSDELLRGFLAAGGGWLDSPGSAALQSAPGARGARAHSPLAPAAPERRPRDVVLLVDASGSMAGAAADGVRAAAGPLASLVPAGDRLVLRFFARELGPAAVLKEAGETGASAAALALALHARPPAGGTDIVGALEELARREDAAARDVLALLLSDGRDPSAPAGADLEPLRERLARARVELAVLAFGPEADVEFLGRLLPPGRAPLRAAEAAELAELFVRAATAERVRESTAAVASPPESLSPGALGRELARALAAPREPLRAWIARAAPGSSVLWRTAQGDPLLAVWPRGLGAAAAYAGWPARAGAPSHATAAALGPLLRALARGGALPALPRAALDGLELAVRGLPPSAPAVVLAELDGFAGGAVALTPPTGVADAPRTTRRATLPSELAAELSRRGAGAVLALRGAEGQALGSVHVAVATDPEFRTPAAGLPEASGAPAAAPPVQVRRPHRAAPWVLAAALALLAGGLLAGFRTRDGA